MAICVPVPTLLFAAHEEPELARFLTAQDEATELLYLDGPEQLCIDGDGKTLSGKRRYTSDALRRLCSLTCPGLYRVLRDLAGDNPTRHFTGRSCSLPEAAEVLNRVIRRRYEEGLDGMRLLCDEGALTVDGLLSRSYQRLANRDFYEQLGGLLDDERGRLRFHAARLYGRRLFLELVRTEPLWGRTVVRDGVELADDYRAGYLFTNAEVGDASVRGQPLVLRGRDGTVAVGRSGRAGTAAHAGKNFRVRLAGLLAYTLERGFRAETLAEAVARLEAIPLGAYESLPDAARRRRLVLRALERLGLTPRQGQLALRGALLSGSFDETTRLRAAAPAEMAGRTLFDLYTSLVRLAAASSVLARDRLCRQAYLLLTGATTLTRDTHDETES